MIKGRCFWGLLVLVAFVGLVLVSSGALAQEGRNVLVYATSKEPNNLDPQGQMVNSNFRLIYHMYDGLCALGPDVDVVYPQLATSWDVSEDGLTWVFHLRDDVYFEDGTHFDSSVVEFSFDRMFGIGGGQVSYNTSIKEVRPIDTYTVQFILKEPFAAFIWVLASMMDRIVPPSVMEHEVDGDWATAWLSDHSLGSGPFQLKSWEKGERIVLEAKEDYWGDPPKIDEFIVRTILEPSTMKMELLAGTIDMADGILPEDISDLEANPDINVFIGPGMRVNFLYFDTAKPPFDDARVRKAVAYAIDYEAINEGVLQGTGAQVSGPVPYGMWGRIDELDTMYQRNLPLARQLLKDAGYPDGFEVTLTTAPRGSWPVMAQVIQSNLTDIGIKTSIQIVSVATFYSMGPGHQVQLGLDGWSPDYPDPDSHAYLLYYSTSTENFAFYKSDEIDRLLDKGRSVTNQAEREVIYRQFHQMVHELCTQVYVTQTQFVRPMQTWVKGFYFNPAVATPLTPFHVMWVEK